MVFLNLLKYIGKSLSSINARIQNYRNKNFAPIMSKFAFVRGAKTAKVFEECGP